MAVTQHCYLSKSSSVPEKGTQGKDWVYFICEEFTDVIMNKNSKTSTAGHMIFQIQTEEYEQSFTLNKIYIFYLGDDGTVDTTSLYYNRAKKFIIERVKGSSSLYLWVYTPLSDTNATYIRWYSGNNWHDYLRVRIAGARFKFSSKKRSFIGSIMLEELTM